MEIPIPAHADPIQFKTLHRELARDIAPSWPSDEPASSPRVRRYDLDPFHVRDYLTGSEFSRKDILGQKAFHRLLCERVDCASGTNKVS